MVGHVWQVLTRAKVTDSLGKEQYGEVCFKMSPATLIVITRIKYRSDVPA